MSVREKIKAIDNKIERNKAQYNLVTQAAKFLLYHQEMLANMTF